MEGERCDFCYDGRLGHTQVREYYRVRKGLVVIKMYRRTFATSAVSGTTTQKWPKKCKSLAKKGARLNKESHFS